MTLPVFLPMAVGVVAGDCVAGEANAGTLRYLLVAPAGRTRLLLTKYASVLVFCLVATLVVALSALLVGSLLFPVGEVTTISGTRIGFGEGLLRAGLIAVVVAASLIGFAAIGLFVSTLTGSGIAAMAATVGLLITVQIVDGIPQLSAMHPYLFPHYWMSYADLLRAPSTWTKWSRTWSFRACTRRCSARRPGPGSRRRTSPPDAGNSPTHGVQRSPAPSAGRAVPRSARRGTNGTNGANCGNDTTRHVPFPPGYCSTSGDRLSTRVGSNTLMLTE